MATHTPQPTLEELLAELKDPHYKVREDAIRKIVKLYRKQAVEPVLGCLTDARSSVRMKALDALGRLRDPRGVQAVTKALNDKIGSVRAKAVRALVALEGLNALNAIAPMLNDPKKPVRQAVLWALIKLNDPNARAALIRIMSRAKAHEFETFYDVFRDKGQGQRIHLLLSMLQAPAFATRASARHAGQSIGGIASTEMNQLLAIMHDNQQPLLDRIFAIDALVAWNGSQRNHHFGMSDLPMLLDLLEHGDPQMRASLVLALDTIQDRAVQKPLLSLLHDADEEVRREALVSFQNYNRRLPSEAIDALIESLEAQDTFLVLIAMEKLKELSPSRAVAPLIRLMEHGQMSFNVACTLESMNLSTVVKSLCPLSNSDECCDNQACIQEDIIVALRELKDPHVISPLRMVQVQLPSHTCLRMKISEAIRTLEHIKANRSHPEV